MSPREIRDENALRAAIASPRFLLFKHSLVCPVSAAAFAEYQAFAAAHPDVPTAWIDVIGSRALARGVETTSGVRHESPQAILFRDGKAAWNASHGAITRKSLATATAR